MTTATPARRPWNPWRAEWDSWRSRARCGHWQRIPLRPGRGNPAAVAGRIPGVPPRPRGNCGAWALVPSAPRAPAASAAPGAPQHPSPAQPTAPPHPRAARRRPSQPPQPPTAPHSPRQRPGTARAPGEVCGKEAAICAFAGPVTVLPAAAASRSLGLLEPWPRCGVGADLDPSAAAFRFPAGTAGGPQAPPPKRGTGGRGDFPPRGSHGLGSCPGTRRVGHLLFLLLCSVGAAPELFSEWMEREVFCEAYHVYVRS